MVCWGPLEEGAILKVQVRSVSWRIGERGTPNGRARSSFPIDTELKALLGVLPGPSELDEGIR